MDVFQAFQDIDTRFNPGAVLGLYQNLSRFQYNHPSIARFCQSRMGKCIEAANTFSRASDLKGLSELFVWILSNMGFVYDFMTQVGYQALGSKQFYMLMHNLGFKPNDYQDKSHWIEAVKKKIRQSCQDDNTPLCAMAKNSLLGLGKIGEYAYAVAPDHVKKTTTSNPSIMNRIMPWLQTLGLASKEKTEPETPVYYYQEESKDKPKSWSNAFKGLFSQKKVSPISNQSFTDNPWGSIYSQAPPRPSWGTKKDGHYTTSAWPQTPQTPATPVNTPLGYYQ